MGCHQTPRSSQANGEKTLITPLILIFLSLRLQTIVARFVINVTMGTDPLTIQFDACQVIPCGSLANQR